MITSTIKRLSVALAALGLLLAVGCSTFDQRQSHRANNLFAYLYSDKTGHIDAETVPVLSLPLKVGIAFVPVDRPNKGTYFGSTDDTAFSEKEKMDLMKEVSASFKAYPFVKSIEIIPTAYLAPRGGFANLDQIRTMYGVDVIALISYDQVQFTDQGLLSLSYWTIVGAYVVQGEKNDTKTMLDAAVYDIASRKLLFRAPGIGDVKGSATLVNLSEQLRVDSERGFKEAETNMVANLKVSLEDFRERVKNGPTEFKVVNKPGYTGAGSFGGLEALFIGGMGACFLWLRRK